MGSFQPNSSNPSQVKKLKSLKFSPFDSLTENRKSQKIELHKPMQFRFYGHFKDFFCWIWGQNVIWSIFRVPLKVWKVKLDLEECEHFQFRFLKNLISNLSLIQKQIFQGIKNVKNCILALDFTYWGQLGSLITSRHAFRSGGS